MAACAAVQPLLLQYVGWVCQQEPSPENSAAWRVGEAAAKALRNLALGRFAVTPGTTFRAGAGRPQVDVMESDQASVEFYMEAAQAATTGLRALITSPSTAPLVRPRGSKATPASLLVHSVATSLGIAHRASVDDWLFVGAQQGMKELQMARQPARGAVLGRRSRLQVLKQVLLRSPDMLGLALDLVDCLLRFAGSWEALEAAGADPECVTFGVELAAWVCTELSASKWLTRKAATQQLARVQGVVASSLKLHRMVQQVRLAS